MSAPSRAGRIRPSQARRHPRGACDTSLAWRRCPSCAPGLPAAASQAADPRSSSTRSSSGAPAARRCHRVRAPARFATGARVLVDIAGKPWPNTCSRNPQRKRVPSAAADGPDRTSLQALHYDLTKTGGLQPVVAPPYDVIDEQQRAELERRSPYNVVHIDLPRGNGDPYGHAAETLEQWREQGAVVRDGQPALWLLEQAYTGPDGKARTRRGFLARVRVEEYGPGRVRPHERTHPGPKEDRLRLTRATKTNLSPIFSLFDDPEQSVNRALGEAAGAGGRDPWGESTDDDGTSQPAVADRGAGRDRDRDAPPRTDGALDRRRSPPLRDGPGLRGGDRGRGPAPLRADVPGRAAGSGVDCVPDPPAGERPHRRSA